jgi:hypothetical protein
MALVTLVATIDAYYGPLKPPYLPVTIALIFFFSTIFPARHTSDYKTPHLRFVTQNPGQ